MIRLQIECETMSDVIQQLTELTCSSTQQLEDEVAGLGNCLGSAEELLAEKNALIEDLKAKIAEREEQLAAIKLKLAEAENKIAGYEKLLKVKEARITELEALLDSCAGGAEDGVSETPTPAAETGETAPPAPNTGTAEEPGAEETPTYNKATVREFLGRAKDKYGVKITDICKRFGGRFQDVKSEDYPALMEAVQKAIDEKEKR